MVDYCYPFSVTSRAFPPPLLTILILLLLFQGLVGAPACGDVMKVREIILYSFWVVSYVCLLPLLYVPFRHAFTAPNQGGQGW